MTAADHELHAHLGIADYVLTRARVRRVSDEEARDAPIGLTATKGDLSGIAYPYLDPATGHAVTHRVRRDHPELTLDGKPDRKYLTPYGDHRHLYLSAVGPGDLANVITPVVLVESEKAALMLASVAARTGRALAPIAMGGCWGWQGRIGRTEDAEGARVDVRGTLPDFDRFTWATRDAIVWLDADAARNGQVAAAQRALVRDLSTRGARVRVARAPDAQGAEGPDDYRARTDDAAVIAVLDAAPLAIPPLDTVADHLAFAQLDALTAPVSPDTLEPRLQRLTDSLRDAAPLRRQLVRDAAIATLKGAKVAGAAALVDAALKTGQPVADADAQSPVVEDDAPWPGPVDTADVLDALTDRIARHVVFPSEAHAHAVALWTLHAWGAAHTPVLPLLCLSSPTKRCGKSTALGVVGHLTPRALTTSNISPAALFRSIEKWRPTLLIDEADTTLPNNDDLRGLLNAGHTRGAAHVIRCVGDEQEPRVFSVWGPKVLAMIGRPPDTVLDRSVLVELRRKTPSDRIEPRHLHTERATLAPLRQQCRRWADDHAVMLATANPAMPAGLHDRAADNWRGLIAIADLAGSTWGGRARAAALALSGVADTSDDTIGVQLLADLREVWPADREWLSSAEILSTLHGLEDRPWAAFGRTEKPLTGAKLARLLRPFGIAVGKVRDGLRTHNAYPWDAIREAVTRYSPSAKAEQRNTSTESNQNRAVEAEHVREGCSALDDENRLQCAEPFRCSALEAPAQDVSADDALTV